MAIKNASAPDLLSQCGWQVCFDVGRKFHVQRDFGSEVQDIRQVSGQIGQYILQASFHNDETGTLAYCMLKANEYVIELLPAFRKNPCVCLVPSKA